MTVYPPPASHLIAAMITAFGFSLAAGCLSDSVALADDTLRGKANIVDGDTIEIAGIPVRLEGIDAPEQRQSCTGDSGPIACGTLATKALARMIGAAPVTCVLLGKDRYDRLLGECRTENKRLNEAMVRGGWALAFVKYSDRYTGAEEEARAARAGERIYHMPFQQHYGRTRIDPSNGERWFRTEDEAQAAGWRRALR